MNKWAKIWFFIATVSVVMAYSLHPLLWESSFFHLTSLAFVGFIRALYLQTTGDWSLAVFVVWLISINSLLDELLFDPTEMDYNEWTGFALIMLITLIQRKKWTR